MREFLQGWRRKVGVCTLVLACLLTGLCVRSYFVEEELMFLLAPWEFDFVSKKGAFSAAWGEPILDVFDQPMPWYRGQKVDDPVWLMHHCDMFGLHGLGIPYLMLILPLALLSVYLIRTKSSNEVAAE